MLDVLREIGARLLSEIRPAPPRPGGTEQGPLPRGAAGDRTHPIDAWAEEIIISGLRASGRPVTVISEEAGIVELNGGGTRVVIDPVDGSRNAVTGIPLYATSIAVADGPNLADVEHAYVLNLVNGDEFWAARGGGAFFNGGPSATQADDVLRLVAYEAHSPGRDIPRMLALFGSARKTRCLGATALSLGYLSCGAVSLVAVPSPSRSFDYAAGWLLVREAGGVFTAFDGSGLGGTELGLGRTKGLLASANRDMHDRALGLLKA